MLFMIRCVDKPDSARLRQDVRPEHIEYIQTFKDAVHAAGPLLNDADEPVGSLLLMDFADRAEAESFAAGDPYNKAGLFAEIDIKGWKQVIP